MKLSRRFFPEGRLFTISEAVEFELLHSPEDNEIERLRDRIDTIAAFLGALTEKLHYNNCLSNQDIVELIAFDEYEED